MVRDAWSADDGQIYISGTYFSSVVGSNWTANVTEISVDGGERDVDAVRCFGSGTNHYMYRKGQTLYEGNIKFHLANNYLMLAIEGGSYASGTSMQTGITGDGLKYPVDITYNFIDRFDVSGAQYKSKFQDAEVTSFTWSMATDGTMEGEMGFKVLPHKYTSAYTPNRIVGSLGI